MYNSGNSSKNVTGSAIVDGTVETVDIADDAVTADKLANSVNTDIATGVSGSTTAGDALPKAGGTMTGTIAGFESTGIDDNATATSLRIDATTGDVSVGVGNSKEPLIQKTNSGRVASNPGFSFRGDLDTGMFNPNTNDTLAFATGGTERMCIDSSGNTEISSSGGWTTIAKDNSDTSTPGLYIQNSSSGETGRINSTVTDGSSNKTNIAFYNSNGRVGSIKTNGSSTSYNTSSDYRLKENVVPMSGSINRLKALNPSKFNFTADADTTVDGFLAHEVQTVVPEAVQGIKDGMLDIGTLASTDEEGNSVIVEENAKKPATLEDSQTWTKTGEKEAYQSIDQSKIVPLLVGALQEAIARIETLENN